MIVIVRTFVGNVVVHYPSPRGSIDTWQLGMAGTNVTEVGSHLLSEALGLMEF